MVTIALIAGMVGCDGYTPSKDIEIRDWHDLDAIRDNLAGNYTLMNNLDSTTTGYEELAGPSANEGRGWEPIGQNGGEPLFPFKGTFDGQGYEIYDLFINRPEGGAVGLFGYVGEGAIIKDVGVANFNVNGDSSVGGLAGENIGTVSNSYSAGSVTGQYNSAGGLVGYNGGIVSDSYSTSSVTGYRYVGGLVGLNGFNNGTVSNSYSTGSVTGEFMFGGILGCNHGTVSNSYYNYDEILINETSMVTIGALFGEDFDEWLANNKFLDINERLSQEDGYYLINNFTDFRELLAFGQDPSLKFRLTDDLDLGNEPNFYIPYLAGEFDGNGRRISNLSLSFDLVAPLGLFGTLASGGKITQIGVEGVNMTGHEYVGGVVGFNKGTLSNSYSTGNVRGYSDYWGYVGGLVGLNMYGTVIDSYSTSNVTGPSRVGGLMGFNAGTVSKSYSTGSVSGDFYVGGLSGSSYVDSVGNSFWDIETSGQTTSADGTGKNTAQMKNIATFSGAGWNISTVGGSDERNPTYIWNIVDGLTYPFLSWQP
jgi:hypothetical protein